jgi:hypothetical protein
MGFQFLCFFITNLNGTNKRAGAVNAENDMIKLKRPKTIGAATAEDDKIIF